MMCLESMVNVICVLDVGHAWCTSLSYKNLKFSCGVGG